MAIGSMKRCSEPFVIVKMQTETTVGYHYTRSRVTKSGKTISVHQDMEQKEAHTTANCVKWLSCFGKEFGGFL
jgi:hypothetical protein